MSQEPGADSDAGHVDGEGDGDRDPTGFLQDALMEVHHLANLTNAEEALQARRRLVDAQSATRTTKKRDRLQEAIEYLELARLERRDAAKGFEKARMLAIRAETALSGEGHVQNFNIDRLFEPSRWSSDRETLADLREQAEVESLDQLRYELALEQLFAELKGEVEADPADPDLPERDLSPDEALLLAANEFADESAARDAGGFEFVEEESLASTGE